MAKLWNYHNPNLLPKNCFTLFSKNVVFNFSYILLHPKRSIFVSETTFTPHPTQPPPTFIGPYTLIITAKIIQLVPWKWSPTCLVSVFSTVEPTQLTEEWLIEQELSSHCPSHQQYIWKKILRGLTSLKIRYKLFSYQLL